MIGWSRVFLSPSQWVLPASLGPCERENWAQVYGGLLFPTRPSPSWLFVQVTSKSSSMLQDISACLWLPESRPIKTQLSWDLTYTELYSLLGGLSGLSEIIALHFSYAFKVFLSRLSFFWCVCVCVCVCVCGSGAWTQGLHLEPCHQPFFMIGFFKIESCKLFAWAGFEPQSSWSLPRE
jgi:hypothetical protein